MSQIAQLCTVFETESLFSLVYFQFFANHFLREVSFDDVKATSQ